MIDKTKIQKYILATIEAVEQIIDVLYRCVSVLFWLWVWIIAQNNKIVILSYGIDPMFINIPAFFIVYRLFMPLWYNTFRPFVVRWIKNMDDDTNA